MTGARDGAVPDRLQEEEGRGSQGALGGLARKVISRRLSWDPTKQRQRPESKSRLSCYSTSTDTATNHRPTETH